MPRRDPFAPEESDPDLKSYDVAPINMPPAPAGANAEIGGEAAASRRFAATPADPEANVDERAELTAGEPEPFLGYDGLPTGEILDWIEEEDPGPDLLQQIITYEKQKRRRDVILDECEERIERWLHTD